MDCRPVNHYTDTPTFSQEGISAVSEQIQSDDQLISIDLESGFHHIPIFPEHQKYVGMKWKGKYYAWCCYPFGISYGPYFFQKTLHPVIVFIRQNGIRLAAFMDDFLLMISCRSRTIQSSQYRHLKNVVGIQTTKNVSWSHLHAKPL